MIIRPGFSVKRHAWSQVQSMSYTHVHNLFLCCSIWFFTFYQGDSSPCFQAPFGRICCFFPITKPSNLRTKPIPSLCLWAPEHSSGSFAQRFWLHHFFWGGWWWCYSCWHVKKRMQNMVDFKMPEHHIDFLTFSQVLDRRYFQQIFGTPTCSWAIYEVALTKAHMSFDV